LGRPDNEAIDFDNEYPVTVIKREQRLRIFVKQMEVEIRPSESWMNLSDRLVKFHNQPAGTLFRIFPTIGTVDNQDSEDHSCDITWEDRKQYWFDIAYDDSRDRRGQAKLIRMIDGFGRVDTLVIRNDATDAQILKQWRKLMEIPESISLSIRVGGRDNCFWGYRSNPDTIPCIFRTAIGHGNASIMDGPAQFKAEQISRILDIKMPPLAQCHVTREDGGPVKIQYGGEIAPLSLKILRNIYSPGTLEEESYQRSI
jgi:hypothetical protein